MAETCIVCLGDLRVAATDNNDAVAPTTSDLPAPPVTVAPTQSNSNDDADEIIAHLLPCGHNMHDSCLKPWVERANSCPICRANFNMVELREFLDGPTTTSYAVQDKQQQAELDPSFLIEEDLFDVDEPCMLCGTIDSNMEVMYCDGCDKTVHVLCAGLEDCPDVWYCDGCLEDLDNNRELGVDFGVAVGTHTRARAREGRSTRARRAARGNAWARVWQSVWDRLNLDLDFPFDDDVPINLRTAAQRREFNAWQRRFQVASRQGAGNRFRDTAATLLDQHIRPVEQAPESQDELRAWNAFDKARELQEETRPSNRRKRKSTGSPGSPHREPSPERKLKRPRTRRNNQIGSAPTAESSAQAIQRAAEGPSFLKALLQEVEKQPGLTDTESPEANQSADGQHSPLLSSPMASPLPSGYATPRGASVTPPPHPAPRPSSPTPLTSMIGPARSPVSTSFSPFSPASSSHPNPARRGRSRDHAQQTHPHPDHRASSPASPSRNMSYSTKREIQRMVKAALGPRYKDQELTKDEYTDINRDVSRLMYDMVGDAEGLAEQEERDRWQRVAGEEVQKAVAVLKGWQE